MLTLKEKWKTVKGYPIYKVSNHGRVKSIARTFDRVNQGIVQTVTVPTRILKLAFDPETGYHQVSLFRDGKRKTALVHRLVARAFLGEPPEGKTHVLHGDDDGTNNHVSNLEWGSNKDNVDDMISKNRQARGSKSGVSVLTEKEVTKIAKLLRAGMMHKDIADKFGVTRSNITMINSGRSWSHVTGFERRT